eukprot:g41261.t1
MVPQKAVKGGEYVSGGGILLEVMEMEASDLLDVDAGGMVGKDKGDLIAAAGWYRGNEDLVEGPVGNGAGESSVEEKGGHFRGSLVEVGLIRTYAME